MYLQFTANATSSATGKQSTTSCATSARFWKWNVRSSPSNGKKSLIPIYFNAKMTFVLFKIASSCSDANGRCRSTTSTATNAQYGRIKIKWHGYVVISSTIASGKIKEKSNTAQGSPSTRGK